MFLSLETGLFILVIGYLFFSTVITFWKGRKFLISRPDEKRGRDYYHNDESHALTLASFSLTALALLVGLLFNKAIPLSNTIQFFSLAFALMVMSFIFIHFRFANAFLYLSEVFLNGGLLSIGCGFLVFFSENVSPTNYSTIVFAILLAALVTASLVNYVFFDIFRRDAESRLNNSQELQAHATMW